MEKAAARDISDRARLACNGSNSDESLQNDIFAAIGSIRELATNLSQESLLFWGFISIALHAAKCGMLLTKVGTCLLLRFRGEAELTSQHIVTLTPTTAYCVMSIFADIHKACSVGAVTSSRKRHLAKLFEGLLEISTRRLATADKALINGRDDGSRVFPSRGESRVEFRQSQLGEPVANVQPFSELEALLEGSIDDFVAQ